MARAKRKSTVLDTGRQRLAGLKSITPPPDFGPNLKVANYETQLNGFSDKIDKYNGLLSTLDELQNELDADEGELRTMNTRMLAASESHYGPDSSEYEMVGGKRRSERKRPTRKTPSKG